IKNLLVNTGYWIKHACDVQQSPGQNVAREDFEEIVHWRKWRAPKLIYMQPAGNAPYDLTIAWSREDEARTNELLTARSERFIQFLDLRLENMAGAAHVAVAQDKEYLKRSHSEPRSPQPETKQAPPLQTERPAQEKPGSASDRSSTETAAL